MKNTIYILLAAFCLTACSDFLSETPIGELTPEQAEHPDNIEGIIISAYAVLDGQFDDASSGLNSGCSNWQFGDVVSDDAYKGGGGTGDQNQIHLMEIFNVNSTILDFNRKWLALYEGVKRANQAIRVLENSDYGKKAERIAEMKFLRGHYYFTLKIIYNRIPYIDETVEEASEYAYISNNEYTSDQLWEKILADFKAAYDVLPDSQADVARPCKMTARAYMAKVYLYQQRWQECAAACDEVIHSGKYRMLPHFRDVFLPENDNCEEIIFSVQASINDGSPNNYNGNPGDRLLPPGGPYPSYGFLRPSQDLVNAYKTNSQGLPLADGKDISDTDYVDPRLDHTVARPGLPFLDMQLYDWTPREATVYGPYSPKKRMVSMNSPYYLQIWPYVNALNFYLIRYPDVLLWRAEAAIETGDLNTALNYINQVRDRVKGSQVVRTMDDTADAANYAIDTYAGFSSKEEAMAALRLERRLEFALEGQRFFDLVRWGIADQVINTYFEKEKTFRSHLQNARFIKGTHEYFPIPQSVLDLSKDQAITQNDGY
ncbi:MAG: RagB/SusD family nutrient uptake outer membrane protein [Tannerellaceae bacterium]|nr:RagB/SusD family nutrient uptake outer membrane protein [Tannerellaceae bacterium]